MPVHAAAPQKAPAPEAPSPEARHAQEEAPAAEWTTIPAASAPLGHRFEHIPLESRSLSPGGGRPLSSGVREHMEQSFGADFSSVRIHEGGTAGSIGALALTRGEDIHFAPGAYNPGSSRGMQALGHELSHVVQQRTGRVPSPGSGGATLHTHPSLELEADRHGDLAARGAQVPGSGAAPSPRVAGGPMPFQATSGAKGRLYKNAKGDKFFSHGQGSDGKIKLTDEKGKAHRLTRPIFKKQFTRYKPLKKGDPLSPMRLGKIRRPFGKKPQAVKARKKFASAFLSTELHDKKKKAPANLALPFDTKPLAEQQKSIDSSALSLMEEQHQQGLMHELDVRNPFHGKMEKRMFVTDGYTGSLVPYESTDKDHVAAQSDLMNDLEEFEQFANKGPLQKEIAMHEGSKTGLPFFTEDASSGEQRVTADAVTSVYNNPDNLLLTDKALNQRVKNDAKTKDFLSKSIIHKGMMGGLDYEGGMFTEDGQTLGKKLKDNLFTPANKRHINRNTLLTKQHVELSNRSTLIRKHEEKSAVTTDVKKKARYKERAEARTRKHDALLATHKQVSEDIDSEDEDASVLSDFQKTGPKNLSATLKGLRQGKTVDIEELHRTIERQGRELQEKDAEIAQLKAELKKLKKKSP